MIGLLLIGAALADCPEAPQIAYDGETFTATFCPKQACDTCFAGATLRRAGDAFHHDLPAVPLTAAQANTPLTLSAKVGPGFVQYVVGVWGEKQACTNGRHGCEAYGYQLEYPAWTAPSYAYANDGVHSFADIAPRRVSVLDAGAGGAVTQKIRARLPHHGFTVIDAGAARAPRSDIEILYRARWDRGRAWGIAAALRDAEVGVSWSVRHWPEAPEAFIVAAGAP